MTRPQKFFILLAFIVTLLSFIHIGFLGFLSIFVIVTTIDLINLSVYPENQFIFPFRLKKIWTEFGIFYIYSKRDKTDSKIYLFQDKLFYLKSHGSIRYSDLDHLKKWTKLKVEEVYKEQILKKQIDSEIETWDGTYDKQSSRQNKLNKILK